jgi:hypothetical protein
MKVALSHSMYYYEILKSVEFAIRILGESLFEAKEEYHGYKKKCTEEDLKDYHQTYKTIESNIEKYK